MLGILDVRAVVIEGRHRTGHPAQHRHRMGIAAETPVKGGELLVDHGVIGDRPVEVFLLRSHRQLAIEEEVADLQVIAMLDEILDGIAAMQQDASVAIDEGNPGLAAAGSRETGIEGEVSGFGIQVADIDHRGTGGSVQDRQRGAPPGPVVDQRHRVGRGVVGGTVRTDFPGWSFVSPRAKRVEHVV